MKVKLWVLLLVESRDLLTQQRDWVTRAGVADPAAGSLCRNLCSASPLLKESLDFLSTL